MSSPYKTSFKTPNKRSIRTQFILQENRKKGENSKNSNIKSGEKVSHPTQIILKNRTRSLTPQPAKKAQVFCQNDLTPKNPKSNSNNLSIRSLTPTPKSRKIETKSKSEYSYSKKSFRSKTPDSKPHSFYNEIPLEIQREQEHDTFIVEREKNRLRNNFIRDMYYIDHKYKNCPCYKCICGKCFCPMRKMRPKGPLINSTYNDDFGEKSMHGDDLCPYKKLKEFDYKPKNNNELNNFLSTYKDCYKEHPLSKTKSFHKDEKYEPKDIPLFSKTNYNENYKDWTKAKDLNKLDLLKPLDHLNTYKNISMKDKTAYNDFFGSKSKDPHDKELNELLKSKREKNPKNPLCTNFRNPFETENKAKYKSHEISEIPNRFNKNEKINSDEKDLPKVKYESDYTRNFRRYKFKPFVCPARVELDKLAALETQALLNRRNY